MPEVTGLSCERHARLPFTRAFWGGGEPGTSAGAGLARAGPSKRLGRRSRGERGRRPERRRWRGKRRNLFQERKGEGSPFMASPWATLALSRGSGRVDFRG